MAEEKMKDFPNISKEEFLSSYSYLSEEEYEATLEDFNKLNQKTVESRFSDTIKTIEDINKVYDRNRDFIEQNISFKYSNPEYNEIDEIEKWIESEEEENRFYCGRSATFKYLDMDEVIEQAFEVTNKIINKESKDGNRN